MFHLFIFFLEKHCNTVDTVSYSCHVLLIFPGVLTETPPLAPEVVSPNMAVGESSNTQLYLVLGAVLGGLLLLVILFLIIFICNRQRSNSQSSQGEFSIISSKNLLCTEK